MGIIVSLTPTGFTRKRHEWKYLHDGFTLPCPPGLNIPINGYITPNTLKVRAGRGALGCCPQ